MNNVKALVKVYCERGLGSDSDCLNTRPLEGSESILKDFGSVLLS